MGKIRLLSLVTVLLSLAASKAQSVCCPQPPPGFDCPSEPLATLTAPIETAWHQGTCDCWIWETHVTQFIAIAHPVVAGKTYEVQYTDDLGSPVWKAYARWTSDKSGISTTDVPVYPCVFKRFFRVCASQ